MHTQLAEIDTDTAVVGGLASNDSYKYIGLML